MCTRPLRFWPSDTKGPNGKYQGIITSYDVNSVPFSWFEKRGLELVLPVQHRYIEVPCGKCPECRNARKIEWVGRCLAEMETTPFTYFLTLTYDNDHLVPVPTKREAQLFIKRLRKIIPCRYLIVGELGDLSNRAHYHAIIFSKKEFSDLQLLKKGTFPLYRSPALEEIWPFGFSSIGMASGATIAYSIGYLVKKEKKNCFKLQSQGLGSQRFQNLDDYYYLGKGDGTALKVALPRYLKEKYGLKKYVDQYVSSLRYRNKLNASGLADEEFRETLEYLDDHKLTK
ncbi:replication initiator protein [Capybara microvirus Cap1_SP_137]|nr:replication initiator protein [Capybara microvirus Cap1_SP_137]